ncbi:hypothetical protein [Herbaspirillum huttiense]|uniref:hypothetical protein n=1 Tax=Herbaspirillum huttiense TaxID=863372 RepID=UPI002E766CE3|nr:hypothetical protein [Herbaspirillum huttiense]MEE1636329.1 hypothetical protein [Herbaspirillum huttiense NC40101]
MANNIINDGEVKAGAQSVVDKDQRIKRLEAAVSTMDSLSQAGFNQVLSIAKLALSSMEQSETGAVARAEVIAHALTAIWSIAENHVDSINFSAEEVGCEFSDLRKMRRMNAQRAVMEVTA